MKHVLIALSLVAALCAAGGCNGNNRSAEYSAPPATSERAVEVEVESRRSPWSYLAFWNWFGGDEAPAVAGAEKVEVEIEDDEFEMEVEREPFTYTRQVREKRWTDYVLPWRWFAEEEVVTEVEEFEEFEEIEVEIERKEKPHPLAFWRWFDDDDDDDDEITEDDVLDDMSPELVTRAETKGETKIRGAKVWDVNTRSIWDDLNEIFFMDRPSRLSFFPTP